MTGLPHDVERIAERAAQVAAARVVEQMQSGLLITRDQMREVLRDEFAARDRSIFEKLGIADDADGMNEFRRNQMWVSDRRKLHSAIVSKGAGAVLAMLLGGVGYVILFWLRGGAK